MRGVPADLASAHSLFARSEFEFERWAVSLVRGTPNERQEDDKGKAGIIRFVTGRKTSAEAIVSVKGGRHLVPAFVRELEGSVAMYKRSELGVLVTLHPPSKGMRTKPSAPVPTATL